jgi:hypothetical protein
MREREADTLTGTLEELEKESAHFPKNWNMSGAQKRERAHWLDHEQRKLAEEYARSGSRLSARLELERLSREDERSRQQREQSLAAVAQRGRNVSIRKGAGDRTANTRIAGACSLVGEEHARQRAELAGLDERLGRKRPR